MLSSPVSALSPMDWREPSASEAPAWTSPPPSSRSPIRTLTPATRSPMMTTAPWTKYCTYPISHYVSTAYLSFCSGDLDLRCLPIIKYLDKYFILRPQINNFEFKECVGSTIYYKYKIYKKLFISTKGYQTSSRVKVLTSIKFIFLMLYFN